MADQAATEKAQQELFEGFEVHYRFSKLKACELTGVMASSTLEPGTRVRIALEAVVVDVNHKTIKEVAGVVERIQTLEADSETAVIVEEA